MHTLSLTQTQRFLSAIQGHPQEAFYMLALTTGLRIGELNALFWEDINMQDGLLHVQRQLTNTSEKKAFTAPKTRESYRDIPLIPQAIASLKNYQTIQPGHVLQSQNNNRVVFCTVTGTPQEKNSILRHSFKPLLKHADLPYIPFHTLRLTWANLLFMAEAHPTAIHAMLGYQQASRPDTIVHTGSLLKLEKEAIHRFSLLITTGASF